MSDHEHLPTSIRVISYNCWGLKAISKHRKARLSEIGTQLSQSSPTPEIVGLQECWTQEDYHEIHTRTKHILPHSKFFHSGIFGSGLVILSKWPIVETRMYRYPLNGRPAAFFRGDWYVGKGVACASLRIGPGHNDIAEVFCTHLHAPYAERPDSYACHRTAQAWEIARLMRHAAERQRLVIAMGDFNMVPSSLAHKLIVTHAPVCDVWQKIRPESALDSAERSNKLRKDHALPTAIECLAIHGATCDSRFNSWRWDKRRQKLLDRGQKITVDDNEPDANAQRLDYIFLGTGVDVADHTWSVTEARVGMTFVHPTLHCSLSDHYSVEATISRQRSSDPTHPSLETDSNYTKHTSQPDIQSTYDEILTMIKQYELRERRQRRWRLSHFCSQVFLSIACLVAVWWSPRNFVSFLLMLLSTFGLSAGVLDGLMGGLFVASELAALKEFEYEIQTARALRCSQVNTQVETKGQDE